MIRNYFKVAFRNLWRHKFYSLINITGLAIGVACCLLITLFVVDELSYDKYHTKGDRMYRVGFSGSLGGRDFVGATASSPTGPTLVQDYPEVESATRFRDRGSYLVRYEDKTFKELGIVFVDGNVFETFDFKLIEGNPASVLTEPNTAVITPGIAEKYFGSEDPIGKTLRLDNSFDYRVTGVMDDIPRNSHFRFDIFLSMESLSESRNGQWMSFNFQTYIVLQPGSDPDALEAKFPNMIETYIGPQVEQYLNITLDEFAEQGNRIGFFLDPMHDIYLKAAVDDELGTPSDIRYVYIFSAIAIFILLIACINFMNLSTARSANRAKEVGVRKVMGSLKRQLVNQFISESVLLSLFAFVLAIGIAYLALPTYNQLAQKQLLIPIANPLFILTILMGALVVGFLAGSYPAFYLSAFKPATVLKGNLKSGMKSSWLRNSLVVFQFATSIILIVATLVIYNQLEYVQNKKLGFNKEQVLVVEDAYALGNQLVSIKEELKNEADIDNVTISGFLPDAKSDRNNNGYFPGHQPTSDNVFVIQTWRVDYDYLATMGIELVDGRNFAPEFPSDSTAIIVNETLVETMGWDNAMGEIISRFSDDPNNPESYHIIGVVKDFHYNSLHENIGPLILHFGNSRGLMSMRLNAQDIPRAIRTVEDKWNSVANGQPFAYSFLDDRFNESYQQEQRIGKIAMAFSSLAIFVACLGLFGLAAFTAEQRTKEIGIRKVLGASVAGIIFILSKDFGRLIIVAFVLATPLAWYVMDDWLTSFAYRTNLSPVIFIIAGLTALMVSWLTMSYQSIKAARANPVDSLKDE